jgi:hypothetical protein
MHLDPGGPLDPVDEVPGHVPGEAIAEHQQVDAASVLREMERGLPRGVAPADHCNLLAGAERRLHHIVVDSGEGPQRLGVVPDREQDGASLGHRRSPRHTNRDRGLDEPLDAGCADHAGTLLVVRSAPPSAYPRRVPPEPTRGRPTGRAGCVAVNPVLGARGRCCAPRPDPRRRPPPASSASSSRRHGASTSNVRSWSAQS